MPVAMAEALRGDISLFTEALRHTVRMTKQNIANRIATNGTY